MDKSKFSVSTEHTIRIASSDLRKILVEVLNFPDNVVLAFSTIERSDFRDSDRWTEVTGIELTYKS